MLNKQKNKNDIAELIFLLRYIRTRQKSMHTLINKHILWGKNPEKPNTNKWGTDTSYTMDEPRKHNGR